MLQPVSPETTIITFDLHGVLFKTDYQTIVHLLWHSKHKKTIIAHALRPAFWRALFALYKRSSPVEQYIMELTHQWPGLLACRPELIAIANAQKPNNIMIELARSLKEIGYELHVFSNIGTLILADLHSRHITVFSIFDHIFTTSASIGYTSKQHPDFFRAYLDSYCSVKNRIILIDDSYKNIQTGRTFGMLGIYGKNASYVRSALKKLGVLL